MTSAYQVQINPVELIATIAVNRGDRTLNADDLKAYIAALSDDDLSDMALKLALFSGGQRMAQLLRAKVSDYDKDSQTLRLWDGKGKRSTPREHLLPLAPKAAAIVEKLIERAKPLETPLLFSSFGKTQLVETTPGKRATAICKAMKCEVRIPAQAGQRFQPKLDSNSKASLTLIPVQPGQPIVIT